MSNCIIFIYLFKYICSFQSYDYIDNNAYIYACSLYHFIQIKYSLIYLPMLTYAIHLLCLYRIKSDLPKQLTRLNRLRPKEQNINDMVFNIFSEFPEFSRPQLESYTRLFHAYDLDRTGKITVEGLKKMMEKLGSPQTHLRKCLLL